MIALLIFTKYIAGPLLVIGLVVIIEDIWGS